MLTQGQTQFAQTMVLQANRSGHIWPNYAAAEACLESAWGTSGLCQKARNIFGLKAPEAWTGETISIPTEEFLKREWVVVPALWCSFATFADAFTERMHVLRANPAYATAILAETGPEFVLLASQHWATDPERGQKVLSVYRSHPEIFGTA